MESFTTHITFTSGDTHKEDTDSGQIVSTIQRLVRGPAAQMGMIKEVKIVDMMDCIVFLARDNKIVFPPPPKK
tara:strand:+ start:132 stop:350 length:219 start_codon:yes stop_codon:yes gene_type:complete